MSALEPREPDLDAGVDKIRQNSPFFVYFRSPRGADLDAGVDKIRQNSPFFDYFRVRVRQNWVRE